MSSRCVIAYIDPILLGVCTRSTHTDAAPTHEERNGCANLAMRMYVDAMRDRERCIFAAPAARALCVQDVYRMALKKMRLGIDYFI